jgi:hypothetical protein
MTNKSLLGVFQEVDEAVAAADSLKEKGIDDFEVLSSTPYPEGVFGEKPSHHKLYVFPFIGALLGFSVAILITAGTQMAYPLVTGGKPLLALPSMFIICYEGTMLGAILFTIIGVVFESRLPRLGKLEPYDTKITEGYIGIGVTVPEDDVDKISNLFKEANATDVHVEAT